MIKEIPDKNTIIHGDFHIKNIMHNQIGIFFFFQQNIIESVDFLKFMV